jgi:hypothetical protein
MSHFLNDRNIRKGARIDAQMRSIPVIDVTSVQYFESFWLTNYTAKYKSSILRVFFLATTHIKPSI